MGQLGDRFDLLDRRRGPPLRRRPPRRGARDVHRDARLGLTATPPRSAAAAARLAELVGPTVFELAVGDLAGGFLASFDAITLYLDLGPEERSAYTRLSALFRRAYAEFQRAAPGRHLGGLRPSTPPARPRAAAPWRRGARRAGCVAFTQAKRRALRSLLGTPPGFPGADLHRRQRDGLRHRARAPRHAADLRHRPPRARRRSRSASAAAISARSCRHGCSTRASTCPTPTSR